LSAPPAEGTTVEEADGAIAPKLFVSVSPHIKSTLTVSRIMWTVVACLLPPLILSVFIFGFQTLIITLVSVVSCVATEAISNKCLGRPVDTIRDGSAVITGLLLAYVIPPGVPYWIPILGGVVAIYVTKVLMGGIGFNIFNPALIGRAFLVATYPVAMTSAWLPPIRDAGIFKYMGAVDAVTTATPLYVLKHYGIGQVIEKFGSLSVIYRDFFIGWRPGCIGETSAFLLIIGGVFLIYKKYVTWHIPVSVIASVAFFTWIWGGDTLFTGNPVLAVLSGGVILGAFFMATDYVTSPTQKFGQLFFGAGIGALTVLIRLRGGYPEGVCYAILLMNALTPAIDSWFKPQRFAPQSETGAS
jgi:electron transport complex protein RnfD